MDSIAFAPAGDALVGACFHCALPIAPAGRGLFALGDRAFCCAGCRAVSAAIAGLGLSDYYRFRAALPVPVDPEATDLIAFDAATVAARFVTLQPDGQCEARLLVEDMRCAACAWLVEQALLRVPGVAAAEVHFATRRAWVRWAPGALRPSDVLGAIRRVGYASWPYDPGRIALLESTERRRVMRRLWVAGLSMMQVMMYALPGYVATDGEIGVDAAGLMRWAGLVLTLPVMAYSAAPWVVGAWRDARLLRLGVDVPVALGILVAFAASVAATLAGAGPVYYDSVTMFVFLLTGARYLEIAARAKAADSLLHLARLVPQASETLAPGDRMVVRAGETVPADGKLLGERAVVSEAWLTGESRPLAKARGELVLGGSVNTGAPLELCVTRVGGDTALASIHRMMERALAERPRWVRMAERASGAFVVLVLVAAAAGFAAWLSIDASRALEVAVAVLVVTCPCAFALATPAAHTAATGRLARGNFVVTRGRAIEALAAATDIVFDKTGTLTEGRPRLAAVVPLAGHDAAGCIALAAALARHSLHPLDRALADAGTQSIRLEATELDSVAGEGLEGHVEGRELRLGRAGFVAALHGQAPPAFEDQDGASVVWLGDTHGWLARFHLDDTLRSDAAGALRSLAAMGLRVHLLSGDRASVVTRTARALGIASFIAEAHPEDKLAWVRALQGQGARVAMVGDGLNDAPVLAQADVSVAMGGGADLAQLRADSVLLSDSLADLAAAVALARRTRRVVRQNIIAAAAYNLIAIPLALAGMVTPLAAGIGMSVSSLAVVANAMRLAR